MVLGSIRIEFAVRNMDAEGMDLKKHWVALSVYSCLCIILAGAVVGMSLRPLTREFVRVGELDNAMQIPS